MTVRRIPVWLLLLSASVVTLTAQEPRRVPQFGFERPIVSAAGPQRLRPDVPLLTGSRTRLGDVRLFDSSGREVPYLLVQSAPPPDEWSIGSVAAIADTKTTSGFEVDFEGLATIDRVRLVGIPAPFMKRALLEGSGDRSRWTVLLDQTTIFDLPGSELRHLDLAFASGAYRYVRVTWDDTNSAKVPPPATVTARKVQRAYVQTAPLSAPVVFERRPSEPGKSRYRIRLPGARLPILALELNVGGGYLLRRATVTESRLMGGKVVPVVVGSATLRKVVEGPLAATALRISIASASEPELDLVVDDGDNAPLDLSGMSITFAELPWIYFESDGQAIVARYGDAALQAPRYDLEAARTTISTEIADVAEARWGDPRPIAPTDTMSAAPATMPTGGAAIDVSLFRFTRALPDGEAGLIAVPLDAAALAHSSGPQTDFADVRVVDANGRQVPYVVERRDEPLTLALALEPRSAPTQPSHVLQSGGTTTYYRARLPMAGLPQGRLVLSTSARVFDRTVSVAVERPADRQRRDAWQEQIAIARWVHANRDTAAPALTLPLYSVDVAELLIAVAEGDNSPLPITSAQVLLPSYRLRLFRAERMPLRVVYGQTKLGPPSYDLALLAPQVLGVAAREVSLSQEQGASGGTNPAIAALVSPRVFWGVLVVAVMALLVLLARLLKREPPMKV
ncbi:MAG TPA: hypothetical protein VJM31_17120 [Vicinamibacterales bacterium]|nr:hypothetical protein [Vicinamibacterales bacterium]